MCLVALQYDLVLLPLFNMPDLRTRYEEIAAASHRVRQQSLADVTPIETAHAFVDEVKIWQVALQDRPEAAILLKS
jgi:hypothetical protein